MWAKNIGVVMGAAGTGVSACLYLLDLATTMSALVTYYSYQYHCPHAHPSSPLLHRDPICRAIRADPVLHSVAIEFWACLAFLLVAHPAYVFIFWTSLHPSQHPLRLAYFMPLIHLYRLLQLLCHSFSFKEIEELQKRQREVNSLYNALGASFESAPQFTTQVIIATRLGEYIRGSADPSAQALRIPTNLMVSILASLASASYGTGMAVSLLMGPHVPLAKRTGVGIIVGCHAIASMLIRTWTYAALSQSSKGFPVLVLMCMIVGMILTWIYVGFSFQSHQCDYKGNNICLKIVHSFVLALMIRPISPIYMVVKEGKNSCSLIWGTLAYLLVDLLGIALVLLRPGYLKERESPCHSFYITGTKEEYNKYLTCKMFLGTIFLSILFLILTTILFIWLYMKNEDNARDSLETSTTTHIVSNKTTSINVLK